MQYQAPAGFLKQIDAYVTLLKTGVETNLIDADSTVFSTGIIVCTIHLAKGLEFDRVIVPDANAETYHMEMDRNLLYIACTRAMHKLTLIALGKPSNLLFLKT